MIIIIIIKAISALKCDKKVNKTFQILQTCMTAAGGTSGAGAGAGGAAGVIAEVLRRAAKCELLCKRNVGSVGVSNLIW